MKSSNPAIGDTTGSRQQAADAEQKQNDAEQTCMEMVHQPSQRHVTGRGIVYQGSVRQRRNALRLIVRRLIYLGRHRKEMQILVHAA